MAIKVKEWWSAASGLFYPSLCVVCGKPLSHHSDCLCAFCNIGLPRTGLHLQKDNEAEKLFWGKVQVERVTSFFYHRKGSDFSHIFLLLKYGGR